MFQIKIAGFQEANIMTNTKFLFCEDAKVNQRKLRFLMETPIFITDTCSVQKINDLIII